MKRTIYINQYYAIRFGLTLNQVVVFSTLEERITHYNGCWYFELKELLTLLPLVTDKVDTIYRHLKSLEKKGLILMSKTEGLYRVSLTGSGTLWSQIIPMSESPETPAEIITETPAEEYEQIIKDLRTEVETLSQICDGQANTIDNSILITKSDIEGVTIKFR